MKTAYFNRFEIKLPEQAVVDCSHSGECDRDVAHWTAMVDLSYISDQDLKAELKEYGAWDSAELSDRAANERRIVWLAAGNIKDETATA